MALGVVAFLGAGVGYETLVFLAPEQILDPSVTSYEIWVILSAMIGACGALLSMLDHFGHRGVRGAFRLIRGGLSVTFLGSLIGGTLAMPMFGTMFGPFAFVMLFVTKPSVGAMWAGSLIAAHILLRGWRVERDV